MLSFHDDVEADEVFDETLLARGRVRAEARLHDVRREPHLEGVLLMNRVHLVIHVEHLAFVEAEGFADVVKGVRVNRLLEGLAQEILPCLRVGDVLEDGEHDVVPDKALSGAEEAERAQDDLAFIGGELVGFPQLDVLLHRDFGGHPVIRAAVEIMFPRPFVFQRHELVHIDGAAVEQPLVFGVDALGDVVGGGTFVGGVAAGHDERVEWL